MRRDYNRILTSWVNGQRSVQEMRKRYRVSNFKVNQVYLLYL